ncbi:MAG: cytochrome bd biosynthesis protein [Oceanospirillaceae bacterium]|nr:cytochrome bd biosynthesis protein [Oceanospirillaceae bacterium]|tara:strand:- start:1794 stop:2099 length:306 start_codon:yes stop_codon:yes gene_type:complete
MTAPVNYKDYGPLYAGWARALSFLMAMVLSGLLLVMPSVVASDTRDLDHGPLSLALIGISAGFIHGVGYVPVMTVWRWLFSPYVGWPVMLWCAWWWSQSLF